MICFLDSFFSLCPRSARSTLFPYTTLFRSRPDPRRGLGRRADRPARPEHLAAGDARHRPQGTSSSGCSAAHHRQDRKSTRLNSSHVAISYAVFCLKKKKEIKQTTHQYTQEP